MGLPSVSAFSDKENYPSVSPHLCCSGKRIMKKKRTQRRRRRIPLQDITHLCNYYSLPLPSGEPNPAAPPSSSSRVLGINMKRIFADGNFNNGDKALKHARVAQVLRKEFR